MLGAAAEGLARGPAGARAILPIGTAVGARRAALAVKRGTGEGGTGLLSCQLARWICTCALESETCIHYIHVRRTYNNYADTQNMTVYIMRGLYTPHIRRHMMQRIQCEIYGLFLNMYVHVGIFHDHIMVYTIYMTIFRGGPSPFTLCLSFRWSCVLSHLFENGFARYETTRPGFEISCRVVAANW